MKFFQQVQRALVPLACAVAALPAMATDVTVGANWNDGYGTADTTLNGTNRTGTAQIPLSLTYGGQTFEAFCMELDQAATLSTVNYTVTSYVNDGFSRLFAAAGFNGSSSGTDAVATRDQKSALQLAVWEVLYDGLGGSLSSGNFSARNFSSASVQSLAQGYLSAAAALQSNQYTTTTLYRYSNGQYQDFVTTQGYASVGGVSAVPEPETAFLWLGGLAGLVALRRRQRRA
ncbi:PEP-CTERM sorting domain-containing protein [Vitreoscilla filiformis]|nr:PEP-CTERM sorting domain-containing protein [Vitreoscilla filiformis]